MCMLDLSNTLMYEFHYNYIKEMFKKICRLQTLIGQYDNKRNDHYEVFHIHKYIFVFSEYPNK